MLRGLGGLIEGRVEPPDEPATIGVDLLAGELGHAQPSIRFVGGVFDAKYAERRGEDAAALVAGGKPCDVLVSLGDIRQALARSARLPGCRTRCAHAWVTAVARNISNRTLAVN